MSPDPGPSRWDGPFPEHTAHVLQACSEEGPSPLSLNLTDPMGTGFRQTLWAREGRVQRILRQERPDSQS